MENTIKLLHLEDNPTDSKLVQSALKKSSVNFEYFFADNEEDFHSILAKQKIDLILSDYHLPDYSGSEALLYAKSNFPIIPFVFLSGTMGEEAAIESLLNGATDYVLKNNMGRLLPSLQRAYKEALEGKARRSAENELRKLSRAVDQSPNSVVITDINGAIEYANSATLTLTGYTADEVIGENPRIFSTHEKTDEEYAFLWNTILSGREWSGEFHNKKKNGELYWESATISPITDDNGIITHFLSIKKDITESKALTIELIKSKEKAEESDRLKSAFLTNISHEIRTPMNGILGFAELLNMPGLGSNEQKEYIQIIKKSGERMLNIINEIVDISKIESGQMKTTLSDTNINEQTEYIHTFFKQEADAKGIKLNFVNGLSSDASIIKTDREKVYAILTNLVKNAIKYTDSGSIEFGYKIVVDTLPVAETLHATSQKARYLQFYIKDTGIGIPNDRQQAVFERFVQADIADKRAFQGAGLGLSISKAYIEMLGGRIWVESVEGKGSAFYFTLPYNVMPIEQIIIDPGLSFEAEKKQIRNLKVLIAEDDEISEMLLSTYLKRLNHEVLKVWTGYKAVDVCRNTPDIDLILMDIKMPGMDGYEATRQIRKFNKDVVIFAQTAYGQKGDNEKAIAAGCNDYISKPIEIDLLINFIQKHFNK